MKKIPAVKPGSKECVLVVSPEAVELNRANAELQRMGYRTQLAFSAREAETLLEQGEFGLTVASSRMLKDETESKWVDWAPSAMPPPSW